MEILRVAFSGASGTGKTTLAKWVSETYKVPFISSSMSDLLPHTSSIPQVQMNEAPLFTEEVKLRENRHRLYTNTQSVSFVTDRSYLDSMAYFLYKLSGKGVANESVKAFLDVCQSYLVKDFTHVVLLAHTYGIASNWNVEDNSKRITNTYFQWMVSSIMSGILYDSFIGPNFNAYQLEDMDIILKITDIYGNTLKVLVIEESDIELRKEKIQSFLTGQHE